ncbi:MAG: hypothetical protein Kow0096_12420 [Thiohalomonadaceae bacterium]
MAFFDVFNGDADGILALHQLRLTEPRESILVTGVKRDIALLKRVQAGAGDHVTVLDIALEKNVDDLKRLLAAGASVRYFDHHFPGDIPEHANLQTTINTSADVCTSILVDGYLQGRYRTWAIAAAFGDNILDTAQRMATALGLSAPQIEVLRDIGTCINYNGYGNTLADLLAPPEQVYRTLQNHADPFVFAAEEPLFRQLSEGYRHDMAQAEAIAPAAVNEHTALYIFPDTDWSRRVSGVYGNALAERHPARAHALLTLLPDGGYRVSVRAPLAVKSGADALCRRFPGGGGRKSAAGINHLPATELDTFIAAFQAQYQR